MMLRITLLALSLIPVYVSAESICLEGPRGGGQCHRVDPNAEIFKSPRSNQAVLATNTATVKTNQTTRTLANTPHNVSNDRPLRTVKLSPRPQDNRQAIAENRIRQRANVIKQRKTYVLQLQSTVNRVQAKSNTEFLDELQAR